MAHDNAYIQWFERLDSGDVPKGGGKNASILTSPLFWWRRVSTPFPSTPIASSR